jgi:hypothetical protein
MEPIRTLVPVGSAATHTAKSPDFRVGYEIRRDVHPGEEHDRAPYNLMLTESADVRLDLPFKSVKDVAVSFDQALKLLRSPISNPLKAWSFIPRGRRTPEGSFSGQFVQKLALSKMQDGTIGWDG